MAGLRLSKDLESDVTFLALHKAAIKARNPSLEESCWAMMRNYSRQESLEETKKDMHKNKRTCSDFLNCPRS